MPEASAELPVPNTILLANKSRVEATMNILGEYVTPDDELRFVVQQDEQDITLGFEGYPWHTHADMLASAYGTSEVLAVDRFVGDLLGDRCIIAVSRTGETTSDVWITTDPQSDLRYVSDDEVLAFRYWNGAPWKPAP